PALAQRAAQAEVAPAGEVAQAVRDQAAAVALDAADDVWAAADDEVGTRVDGRTGERARVAAVLAERELGAARDVCLVGTLGAGVHGHHDEIGARRRTADQRAGPR